MKKLLLGLIVFLMAAPAFAMETPNIDFGGHVRFRGYNMQNFWDFQAKNDYDNWSVFRLQSELHAKADVGDHVSAYVRFSNQNYGEGVSVANTNTSDKVFVENAYIDVNKFFGLPVSLRFGRQNLMYGSGFVVFDGQSQYASTALFFDGVKMSWDITDNTKLDLFYLKEQENVRGDDPADDINLSGAYLTMHCPIIGGQQELYVLNRNDKKFLANDGKNIWMYGLRLSDKYECGIDYSGEIAYQNGQYDVKQHITQDALGYKLEAGYTAKMMETVTPRIFIGYTYLSGDKADTTHNEAWDVFYGGWPQYGDLLAWVYVNLPATVRPVGPVQYNRMSSTVGEAAFTNLQMPKVGLSATCGPVSAMVSYTKLTFDQTPTGVSDDFGDYYQLQAKYRYNKHLSFAAYGAMIKPGKAFPTTNRNTAYETFWETRVDF